MLICLFNVSAIVSLQFSFKMEILHWNNRSKVKWVLGRDDLVLIDNVYFSTLTVTHKTLEPTSTTAAKLMWETKWEKHLETHWHTLDVLFSSLTMTKFFSFTVTLFCNLFLLSLFQSWLENSHVILTQL